jgi:predicted Fe-Mo cluster-binding NifX family protein
MKIAITSQGADLESPADPRFGRAKWFLIVDTENNTFEAVDNVQNLNAARGAGIQAAQNVASYKVDAIVTGHVGPNAFRTLQAAGIKVYIGAQGTVLESLEKFKGGELEEAGNPDVEGHWV